MKHSGGVVIVLLLFIGGFFSSRCGGDGDVIDTVATPINGVVSRIRFGDTYYEKKTALKTRIFYRANEYHRIWLRKRGPGNMFKAFVRTVKESERFGFDPSAYHIDELEAAVEEMYDRRKRRPEDIAALDIRITATFFLFTTHLIEGRVRYPGAREFLWKRGDPLENDIALLIKMEDASDLNSALKALHPTDPQYERLQKKLRDYKALIEADTVPLVPENLNVNPGDVHEAIPLVRRRISLMGENKKNEATKRNTDTLRLYDARLQEQVKEFQLRHGLTADGKINKETIRSLNVGIRERIELISLNLERLRWLPHLQGEGDEIVVNVPEFMMRVYRDGKEKLKMRVVLGAEYTPTPVFHDTIKYVVFNPTWAVPKSIFKKEMLPKLKDDAGHFDPERFRLYNGNKETDPHDVDWNDEDLDLSAFRVVENPGEMNALGKIKFMMPNDFSIYLHDTPANKHFDANDRALSHGCVRLEAPLDFAKYLLSDEKGWTEKKIREVIASGKTTQIDLNKSFPVYIVYRTVWVDDDGSINFREDIYGHDKRHLARLEK